MAATNMALVPILVSSSKLLAQIYVLSTLSLANYRETHIPQCCDKSYLAL